MADKTYSINYTADGRGRIEHVDGTSEIVQDGGNIGYAIVRNYLPDNYETPSITHTVGSFMKSDGAVNGWKFAGWRPSSSNQDWDRLVQPGDSVTLGENYVGRTYYSAFKKYELSFGDDAEPIYGSGDVTLPDPSSPGPGPFIGWEIGGAMYAAGETYDLAQPAEAVARWATFSLAATKRVHAGITELDAGTLTLRKDGEIVATESDGEIFYTGAVDGSAYALVCTMADGYAAFETPLAPSAGGSLEVTCDVPLYFVGQRTDNEFPILVTSPSAPDAEHGGKNYYAGGRGIVLSADIDDEEKSLASARLYDENDAATTIVFSEIVGDSFAIERLTQSYYVDGTFAEKRYGVACEPDAASASVLAVAVSETSVTKGTLVTFTATPAAGYSFGGWYRDGEKIDGAEETYSAAITEDTHLVAKAKVAVTLSLYAEGSGTITVNGKVYESGTPFDVMLGDSFTYALSVTDGKSYRGWYSSYTEQSKLRLSLDQSGTFAPTAALAAIAVVLDTPEQREGDTLVVKIAYANTRYSKAQFGTLFIDGGEELVVQREYHASPQTKVTLLAVPRNGYKFTGWYENSQGEGTPISKDAEYVAALEADLELYARFDKNRYFICEWEGSETPKVLVWRSKTYEASKPFSPSACRVDALGYPPGKIPGLDEDVQKVLEFRVDMFSAPDSSATATARLPDEDGVGAIASQEARRLPVRRMERYMQIEVRANSEVDALLVGTSMGGLAV